MIINDSDYDTLESDKVIRFDRKTWEYFLASISLTYGRTKVQIYWYSLTDI